VACSAKRAEGERARRSITDDGMVRHPGSSGHLWTSREISKMRLRISSAKELIAQPEAIGVDDIAFAVLSNPDANYQAASA
jgi:hypothetical protein